MKYTKSQEMFLDKNNVPGNNRNDEFREIFLDKTTSSSKYTKFQEIMFQVPRNNRNDEIMRNNIQQLANL
jgi:hypothetical protein